MKHTPGPWEAIEHPATDGGNYITIVQGSWDIAHNRHSARDWEEELANARLIKSAPDLLEALKQLVEWAKDAAETIEGELGCGRSRDELEAENSWDEAVDNAMDAIAQATQNTRRKEKIGLGHEYIDTLCVVFRPL